MQRVVLAILALMWLAALVIYAANSGTFTAIEKEFHHIREALQVPAQQSSATNPTSSGLFRQVMRLLANVTKLVKRYTELATKLSKLNPSQLEELRKELEAYQRELETYREELMKILTMLNSTKTITPISTSTSINQEKLLEELRKLKEKYLELYERLKELEKQLEEHS